MNERLRLTVLVPARLWPRLASGTAHNTHCPFGRAKTSHINSDRADNSPLAGPFDPEFMSDNVALCAIPLRHCHGACCPDLAFVRRTTRRCGSHCGTHRASLQASFTPTPPQLASAPRTGASFSRTITHPLRLRPFHPQGAASKRFWTERQHRHNVEFME